MPVPFRRVSKTKKAKKFNNKKIKIKGLSLCNKCNKIIRSHYICGFCGFYNKKLIINKKEKKNKKV